jgi:23S rRNA (adenine2503-C2)-methyltransferase
MTQTESRFPAEDLGLTLEEFAARTQMHVIPARPVYRKMMRQAFGVWLPAITRREDDGGTVKFCLPAGEFSGKALESESVIIPMTSYRASSWHTLCVSTQIGCRMGCIFCETGKMGLLRNLSAAEIVRQRIVAGKIRNEILSSQEVTAEIPEPDLQARPRRGRGPGAYFADGIQNIVFMGMGEPLANYGAMWKAVEIINDPRCIGIGARNITISTVGLIPGIRRLAREKLQVNLAISLHAADDELRRRLIPTAGQPVADLVAAAREFFAETSRRVSFEYVLIAGVNDSVDQARQLADLVSNVPSHVNLIPVNPTSDSSIRRPSRSRILAFQRVLREQRIACTVRVEKGVEIESACGQLRGIRNGHGRRGLRRGEIPVAVSSG